MHVDKQEGNVIGPVVALAPLQAAFFASFQNFFGGAVFVTYVGHCCPARRGSTHAADAAAVELLPIPRAILGRGNTIPTPNEE